MEDIKRLLENYDWEHPFPLTLKAYDGRPSLEKSYAVVIAHNSAQHAWHYLTSIWEMINEEMLEELTSSNELLSEGFELENLKNYILLSDTIKRLRNTPVHITSFYIYARIFLDRSTAFYPVLTSYQKMPPNKRGSLPNQYYWLKNNKSEEDIQYFEILEKYYSNLNDTIIHPRNNLISHNTNSTEQFRMGGSNTPIILYEKFSLKDESFILDMINKYGDLIKENIAYPKQDAPNTIRLLIERGDKLDLNDLDKLKKINDNMREELPAIEKSMKHVDCFRESLDIYYSSLINNGILASRG